MKATIVGLVTPHVLRVMELAGQAERGVNIEWHLRDAVASTIAELAQQYNADELLAAYAQGLEAAADDAGRRTLSAQALRSAAAFAARERERRA